MLPDQIDALGKAALSSMISPLKRSAMFKGLVLGFDTEYDSKSGKLLSWQLSDGKKSVWDTSGKLTVHMLAKRIVEEYRPAPEAEVMLVAFFSIAELQFLPVKNGSFGWREYGAGSFDCSFFDPRSNLSMHVFDLARFFDKQPLSKVAASFGLKKLEWDRTRITKASLKKKGFKAYALNDAVLAAKIMAALREQFSEWQVDPLHERTAASTASAVFRRGWVHEEIKCESNEARLSGLRACWGGRAEAIERGSFAHLREYDLSSAYPLATLAIRTFPCGDSWSEIGNLRELRRCVGGVARIRFSFPHGELYPCLPVVLPQAQLYPLSGEEWVTFREVKYALDIGCKVTLLQAFGYRRGTTILADYMTEMLERRKKAEGAQKTAVKLLMNSLIGKLAQRVTDIDVDSLRLKAEEKDICIDDIGKMTRDELAALGLEAVARVGSLFMPEWNTLITGEVRARIGELARDYSAVYIATDAIWTQEKIKKLPADLTLKREGPGIVARTRLGAIFDDEDNPHVAHHSIWSRKAGLESLQNLDGPSLKYTIRRPIKLRESLRKSLSFGRWVEETRESNSYWDQKRRLHDDGTSEPWRNVGEYLEAAKLATRERRQRRKAQDTEKEPSRHGGSAPKNRRGRKS